ncbi:MAG: 50S ribosomal protein L15 [Nitrososphaerota archaeon]
MLRKIWNERSGGLAALMRQRMVEWRREPAVVRVHSPLRLDRARSLGYKTKRGYIVLRVRVRRGGFQKPRPRSGRRPKAIGVTRHKVNVSMKEEAINRVVKTHPNLKPLGAYPLARDSLYKWFEVVAVDPHHPATST